MAVDSRDGFLRRDRTRRKETAISSSSSSSSSSSGGSSLFINTASSSDIIISLLSSSSRTRSIDCLRMGFAGSVQLRCNLLDGASIGGRFVPHLGSHCHATWTTAIFSSTLSGNGMSAHPSIHPSIHPSLSICHSSCRSSSFAHSISSSFLSHIYGALSSSYLPASSPLLFSLIRLQRPI